MKKRILTLIMAVTTISIARAEQVVEQSDNTTDVKSEVVEEGAKVSDTTTEAESEDKQAAPAKEESNNTVTYAIIAGSLAGVGYAVYRKRRKAAERRKGYILDESNTRVLRHKELTMDYLLERDAQECVANGAVEMNLFRLEALTSAMPMVEVKISNVDEHNALMCVGVDKAGEMVYTTLHCANSLDERLSAAVNSKNTIKIKF